MGAKCGCVTCDARTQLAPKGETRGESHMEIFRRLAAVKIMHGTPGEPKHKNRG